MTRLLDGIKVLDVASFIAGPCAATMMAATMVPIVMRDDEVDVFQPGQIVLRGPRRPAQTERR